MSTNSLSSLQQLANRCAFEQMSDRAIEALIERYPELPKTIQDTIPQNDCSSLVNAAIQYDSPIRMRFTMIHPGFSARKVLVFKRVVTENKQNIIQEFTINAQILPEELGGMLSDASRLGNQGIVRIILTCNRCSEIPLFFLGKALYFASREGHSDIVKDFCLCGQEMPAPVCGDALSIASEKGHLGIVKTLLDDPVISQSIPQRAFGMALEKASQNNQRRVVLQLLSHSSITPHIYDLTKALLLASAKDLPFMVGSLLQYAKKKEISVQALREMIEMIVHQNPELREPSQDLLAFMQTIHFRD